MTHLYFVNTTNLSETDADLIHKHSILVSQIIQLGAQFCLNIFIYVSSLHILGIKVPIIRRKSLYLCDTGIFHSGWVVSGRLVGLKLQRRGINTGLFISPSGISELDCATTQDRHGRKEHINR